MTKNFTRSSTATAVGGEKAPPGRVLALMTQASGNLGFFLNWAPPSEEEYESLLKDSPAIAALDRQIANSLRLGTLAEVTSLLRDGNSFLAASALLAWGTGWRPFAGDAGAEVAHALSALDGLWSEEVGNYASHVVALLRMDAATIHAVLCESGLESESVSIAKAACMEALLSHHLLDQAHFRMVFQRAEAEHGLMANPRAREVWIARSVRFDDELILPHLVNVGGAAAHAPWADPVFGWQSLFD